MGSAAVAHECAYGHGGWSDRSSREREGDRAPRKRAPATLNALPFRDPVLLKLAQGLGFFEPCPACRRARPYFRSSPVRSRSSGASFRALNRDLCRSRCGLYCFSGG